MWLVKAIILPAGPQIKGLFVGFRSDLTNLPESATLYPANHISTIANNPDNLTQWDATVNAVIDEYYT